MCKSTYSMRFYGPLKLDSNNISIGIHFFKVLVQIHYSRSPGAPE